MGIFVLFILLASASVCAVTYENSKAKWMWIVNDGYGNANIKSEKTGTWTAELNKIGISIQGNTGTIKEEFTMKNGIFHDNFTNRYLERKK